MITVEKHLTDLLAVTDALPPTELPLASCRGTVVAADLHAVDPMPAFDNSAMDGYAVRAADIATAPVTLPVVADLAAGDVLQGQLAPGSAARIMTGAAMPAGAECVIPVEQTDRGTVQVRIERAAPSGHCVRPAGDDVRTGDLLLAKGDVLNPARIGLAAAAGQARLQVIPRPRVVVVSTGAELQPPGSGRDPGKIFDSNGPMLAALAGSIGLEAKPLACHTDDPDQFSATIAAAVADADLVITSGGVSAGSYEVVKSVLGQRDGFEFRQVAMQPGKPQGFGRIDGTVVVNLPGNPVSATVSFMVFVRPVVARLAGREPAEMFPTGPLLQLAGEVARKPVRQFLRGSREAGAGTVTPSPARGSHLLAGMARADCLVVIPEGEGMVAAGSHVDVIPLP